MTETSKRAYSSDLRTEQARRTRKQIVDAAAVLFAEQGFAGTTVDAIAKAAGVSRKTVFTAVPGGKTELLKLAYDFTLAGDDEPVPMIAREGIQSLIREPDPYRQMRAYARFITDNGSRIAPLYLALRGAAEVDPEARNLYLRWEGERRFAMLNGPIPGLIAAGALRSDVTPDEAADILSLLVMPSIYHQFVTQGGWTDERFSDWLGQTICTLLLKPAPTDAPPDQGS
jgi:TetR/AcrR family transcriptional regulator, regulator of autoinduction and epiphytic fitness